MTAPVSAWQWWCGKVDGLCVDQGTSFAGLSLPKIFMQRADGQGPVRCDSESLPRSGALLPQWYSIPELSAEVAALLEAPAAKPAKAQAKRKAKHAAAQPPKVGIKKRQGKKTIAKDAPAVPQLGLAAAWANQLAHDSTGGCRHAEDALSPHGSAQHAQALQDAASPANPTRASGKRAKVKQRRPRMQLSMSDEENDGGSTQRNVGGDHQADPLGQGAMGQRQQDRLQRPLQRGAGAGSEDDEDAASDANHAAADLPCSMQHAVGGSQHSDSDKGTREDPSQSFAMQDHAQQRPVLSPLQVHSGGQVASSGEKRRLSSLHERSCRQRVSDEASA